MRLFYFVYLLVPLPSVGGVGFGFFPLGLEDGCRFGLDGVGGVGRDGSPMGTTLAAFVFGDRAVVLVAAFNVLVVLDDGRIVRVKG